MLKCMDHMEMSIKATVDTIMITGISKIQISYKEMISFKNTEKKNNTIAANRVDGGIVLVEDQIVDRSFMRLELACNFLALNIDEFDLAIAATNSDLLASLVELADVSNCVTCVDVEDFLHHPDVPHFDDSVRVTRRDVLPAY